MEDHIKQMTVVEQAMERIKGLISSGNYKVNDKLPTQDELAALFGIGRNSIREALKVFHHLGVLVSKTGKGTILCGRENINKEALTWSILLGNNDVFEMVELREIVEAKGMNTLMNLCERDIDRFNEYVGKLSEIISKMRVAADNNHREDLISADFNFHSTIISVCENSLLNEIFKTLKSFTNEKAGQINDRIDFKITAKQHERILRMIKTKNKIKAIDELYNHIAFIRETLADIISSEKLDAGE